MSPFIKRVAVVLKSAPTYLVAASTVVAIVTEEIAEELPSSNAEWLVKAGGKVVAVIGAAVAIIRRSTPVIEAQRGLLPVRGEVIPEANV